VAVGMDGQGAVLAPPIKIDRELCEHPIITQLTDLDVDGMTPIQALMLLNQWKDMIKD
jgi:DNA mismatch repair protein MutS